MAISPTSDILLDVANAADPNQVRVATARLAKLAADPAAPADFDAALSDVTRAASPGSATKLPLDPLSGTPPTRARDQIKGTMNAYQKFEALLLQSFIEEMLPKDDELYGDKISSGPYRSMMAEQLANQFEKSGGIGIAKAVEAKHPPLNAPVPTVQPTINKV
jgi:hypothetical protein